MNADCETNISRTTPKPNIYGELEVLDAEITELAPHIHAAIFRWLSLVRKFDDHPGVGAWGLKSTAHYLSWRCGIGLTAAREHVRVARALDDLPRISEAFSKGELSYAKVRAMTRVATPQTEEYFRELALHGTASHIERLVREYRQVHVDVGLEARKPARVRRTFRYHWDEDGRLGISGRLPAEEGALVLKALEAGVRTLEQNSDADASAESSSNLHWPPLPEPYNGDEAEDTFGAVRADAFVGIAQSFIANGPRSLSGAARYQIVLHASQDAFHEDSPSVVRAIEDGPGLSKHTARRIAAQRRSSRTKLVGSYG